MEKMNNYIQTDNLDDYKEKEFTGYCWMSDKTMPQLIDDKNKFTLPAPGENPFVAEANLYAKDGSVSVSIEQNDGLYHIGIVNWNEVVKDESVVLEEQTYLTHRMENELQAILVRAWIPVKDPLCEYMEVLQPAWRAFAGFGTLPEKIKEIINRKNK